MTSNMEGFPFHSPTTVRKNIQCQLEATIKSFTPQVINTVNTLHHHLVFSEVNKIHGCMSLMGKDGLDWP